MVWLILCLITIHMLVVECLVHGRNEVKVASKKRKWRLRDVGWENFQVDLSARSWDNGGMHDVEYLNERLVEDVRSAAESKIGYVRVGRRKKVRKPWWNDEIREARKERKRMSRQCRWLRKKRHESDEAENEYQNAWEIYVKQQRLTKRMIVKAKVKCERNVIESLREKGMEGGREWYKFLRGENMSSNAGVESLKVNGEVITEKEGMREAIKQFWEEVGGVGEVFDVRERCVTLERKDADVLNERISREVMKCVKKQKNGKAAGPLQVLPI